MTLARWPAGFDVLVTENLFGDILSDEAAVIAGSLGHAAVGVHRHPARRAHGRHGLYEPIHGSAPDIAGKDLANPLGTILSAAMMLRWSLGQPDAAAAIEAAVDRGARRRLPDADLLPAGRRRGRRVHPRRHELRWPASSGTGSRFDGRCPPIRRVTGQSPIDDPTPTARTPP